MKPSWRNRRLQDLIYEVRVPVEIATEIKDGKEREVEHKLFPGYVLVKMIMTDDSWYVVRNARGVTGFVGPSSKPVPLSDEEVEKLGMATHTVQPDFAVGENVQIVAGALEGFIGLVESIDAKAKKVSVKVSMFGRENACRTGLHTGETPVIHIFSVRPACLARLLIEHTPVCSWEGAASGCHP